MLPLLGFWQLDAEDSDPAEEAEDLAESSDSLDSQPTRGKRAALYSQLPRGMQFHLSYEGTTATLELVEGGVQVKAGSQLADPPRRSCST